MWTRWLKIISCTLLPVALCIMIITSAGAQTLNNWFLIADGSPEGTYDCSGNPLAAYDSDDVGILQGKDVKAPGAGSWMCRISAEPYRAQRLRLSAYIKTEDVTSGAGLWMRINGPDRQILAIDNMQNRTITGTTSWTHYEVVLDAPKTADSIDLGTYIAGAGTVWTGSLSLDIVGEDVAVTDMSDQVLSPRPPKDILKQMSLFIGEWKGTIHQVMADGSEYDWEIEMNGKDELNGFSIVLTGSIQITENYAIDFISHHTWDAAKKRMIILDTSSEGEVTVSTGKWLINKEIPSLEMTDLVQDGAGTIANQVITFPEDAKMAWEVTWESDGGIIHQTMEAQRQQE